VAALTWLAAGQDQAGHASRSNLTPTRSFPVTYMVAAYLIIWLVSFVLILSMVFRQRKIDQELALLREALQDKDTGR
jgi:CcmD family protein